MHNIFTSQTECQTASDGEHGNKADKQDVYQNLGDLKLGQRGLYRKRHHGVFSG